LSSAGRCVGVAGAWAPADVVSATERAAIQASCTFEIIPGSWTSYKASTAQGKQVRAWARCAASRSLRSVGTGRRA
jgi:hypothetical protein